MPAAHCLTRGRMQRRLPNEAASAAFAAQLARSLQAGDVLCLNGALGSGKTTFVRALVAALGGDVTAVHSPTYTLMHSYTAEKTIIHVDAYRLQSNADLEGLGFYELMDDHALGCIEWAERLSLDVDAGRCWQLDFEHADNNTRLVTMQAPPDRQLTEDLSA